MSTTHQLSDVKGIGEKTAADLTTAGIDSVAALAAASTECIIAFQGRNKREAFVQRLRKRMRWI